MSNTAQHEPREGSSESGHEVDLSLSSETTVPITSRPGLVPIFTLCLLVMGVGFYFALQRSSEAGALTTSSQEQELASQWSNMAQPSAFATLATRSVHALDQPVSLPPLDMTSAPSYAYTLVQELDAMSEAPAQGSGREPGVRTLLSFQAAFSPASQERTRDVRLDDISLAILSSHDPFATRLTDQLAARLDGSSLELFVHRTGVPERVIWNDGPHLKLEPLLKLLESGVMLLSVSLPSRPVMAQEPWHYTIPLTGLEVEGVKFDGKLAVEASLRGNTSEDQSGAQLISQKFEVRLQGSVPGEIDGEAVSMIYQLEGEGEGALLLDPRSGLVTEQEMRLKLELGLDVPSLSAEEREAHFDRKNTLLMRRNLLLPSSK